MPPFKEMDVSFFSRETEHASLRRMDGCTDRRTDRLTDIHADGKSIALGICKLCVSIRHSETETNRKQRDEKVHAVRQTD